MARPQNLSNLPYPEGQHNLSQHGDLPSTTVNEPNPHEELTAWLERVRAETLEKEPPAPTWTTRAIEFGGRLPPSARKAFFTTKKYAGKVRRAPATLAKRRRVRLTQQRIAAELPEVSRAELERRRKIVTQYVAAQTPESGPASAEPQPAPDRQADQHAPPHPPTPGGNAPGAGPGLRSVANPAVDISTADTADSTGETPTQPVVSVIIPVHNAIDDTLQCLRSLAENRPAVRTEIIVANDLSDPDSFAPVREVEGVTVLDNSTNLGFLHTCNRAAESAAGEYLFFLNSDTEVAPGAIDALVATFSEWANVGIAGSQLRYGDGTLQEAGGIVWNDATAWNYGKGGDANDPRYSYAREVDYVSGAALMVSRAVWDHLGGFDTAFAPAYYEDTDLCMAARQNGYRVIMQPASIIIHHEGRSYGTDTSQEGKHHQVVNHETFLRKWRTELQAHRNNAEEPEREKERSVRSRVLVIDARMLTPDKDSGSLRMRNMCRAVRDLGAKCTFLPHNQLADEPYASELRSQGIEVIGRPYIRSVEGFLAARGAEFDVVLMSRLEVASEHLTTVRQHCPKATVVYDTVDLHFLRQAREAELTGAVSGEFDPEATREAELAMVSRSDATLVCSTVEKDLLGELAPQARIDVLGNVHEPTALTAPAHERSGMLFVGGFEHPPNVDAVQWFVADILPLVTAAQPTAQLHIVGSRMIPEIEALASNNVVIHGFVPDLDPLYLASRVSVAPLRFGAGVKGKITGAMAHGLPSVGTTVAVEGAPFVAGEDLLVGDTPAAFAEAVVELLTDDALWERLHSNGMDAVGRHFGMEAAAGVLAALIDTPAPLNQ